MVLISFLCAGFNLLKPVKPIINKFRLLNLVCGDEFVEEAAVVFAEEAEVFNLIFEVGDSLDTHAEGEAGVFFGVDTAGVEHGRIYHAAAKNLNPSCAFAERAAFAAAEVTADIHFG